MQQDALLKWFFTWERRVQSQQYFLVRTALVALKYAIDWSVAARFGETWRIWNYSLPLRQASLFGLGSRQPELYGILWAIAAYFFGWNCPHSEAVAGCREIRRRVDLSFLCPAG